MYPELFHIGSFPINTYGVLLALAFLTALFVAARLGARDGLPRERVFDLGLWMLLGGLVGSKLLLMVAEPEYASDLWRLVSLDFLRSGGVWYGGFLGGLLTGALLIRRYRLPFWKVTDAFAPGVALGQAIGRQGCFAAGCCWGKPTTLPWGVEFGELAHRITGVPVGVHLHDTRGLALANALTAIDAGAVRVDAAVGGLGGCPFAPGASGNLATEDLVHALEAMGIATGVDLDQLIAASRLACELVGRPVESHVGVAGPRFRGTPYLASADSAPLRLPPAR